MKRVITSLCVLLFLFSNCFAQPSPGARQVALAHSDVSCPNDVFALFLNPAALANQSSRELGFFYSPAPFDLKELSSANAVYCEPFSSGSIAAGFSIFGFELYRETKLTVGYGAKISGNFLAGISAAYQNISIRNYGSRGVLILGFGAVAHLSKEVGLGFSVENISRSSAGDESNQIPTVMWLGTDLKFVKEITFTAAVKKEIGFNPSLRIGAEYSILDFLKFRIGASNEPDTYSGGIGIIYKLIEADYAISSHSDLGLTHQFGLVIRFTNK